MSQQEVRPTKKLDLPFTGGSVLVKEWITGREQNYIEQPTTQSVEIKPDQSGRVTFGKLDTAKLQESTNRAIESIVVEVNGKKEGILDSVLDLPTKDYNAVVAYVQELIKKN